MIPLPRTSSGYRDPLNPFNGRWRQWYVDIADWMITHPGGTITDCAKGLNKHFNTISYIVRSDTFQHYYSQRRAEHSARQDEMMRAKLTGVASKSLDVILDKLNKQGDQIPMKFVTELATGALDRLGYAPATPGTSVNINTGTQSITQVTVSAEALAEARDAMRAAEEKRAIESRMAARVTLPGDTARQGTGPGPVLDLIPDADGDDTPMSG
jgi:hypothetical protein